MIMKRTKGALFAFVAAVALCLGLVGTAFAAVDESEVSLAQDGSNVRVTLTGNGQDVSAFSLVLDVEPDVPGAVQVGFDFSGTIEEGTSIHEAKLSTVGDKTRVTLYVAGGHDLFAAPLDVGSITLALDAAASSGADVVITVPEVDDETDEKRDNTYALRTVSGSYGEDEGGVYLNTGDADDTGVFTAHLGERTPSGDGNGDGNGGNDGGNNGGDGNGDGNGDGGNGNGSGITGGDYTGMNPDDGYAPSDPYRKLTSVRGDALSQTGDTLMPIVVGLLCLIAAACGVLAFLVISRRKKKQD